MASRSTVMVAFCLTNVIWSLPKVAAKPSLHIRRNVGAAGGEGDLGEREQCGMCCLHIGAIGQADEDAIRGGDFVDAGSVGAEEMAWATGVGDGSGLWGVN